MRPDAVVTLASRDVRVGRTEQTPPDPPWTAMPDVPRSVTFIDTADAVCTRDRCPAVIGNVLVHLDDNHLTATYAATMAPLIEDQVHAALG